jgi:hypothetical protein
VKFILYMLVAWALAAMAAHAGEIADCAHDRAIEWAESPSHDTNAFFSILFSVCVPDDEDDDAVAKEVQIGLRRALAEKYEEFLRAAGNGEGRKD